MIKIGISPCPNDTFIFCALVNKVIDTGLALDFVIEDVETLNRLALKRKLDVTKISCHAFYYLKDDYIFLKTGGAFGRGCGPLLVKRPDVRSQKSEIKRIAIPGEFTTAFLLLKLFLSSNPSPVTRHSSLSFITMPFYEIMRAVSDGVVDAGLIIHESRFTYHEYGLVKIVDLGDWWEKETGLPIPLGGIIAKKSLGVSTTRILEDSIRASVKYSYLNKEKVMPFIKEYARELSEDVILKHISLYVNNFTLDIGAEGESALNELMKKANLIIHNNGGDA